MTSYHLYTAEYLDVPAAEPGVEVSTPTSVPLSYVKERRKVDLPTNISVKQTIRILVYLDDTKILIPELRHSRPVKIELLVRSNIFKSNLSRVRPVNIGVSTDRVKVKALGVETRWFVMPGEFGLDWRSTLARSLEKRNIEREESISRQLRRIQQRLNTAEARIEDNETLALISLTPDSN